MKLILLLILVSFISHTSNLNCNGIVPKNPEDCALSLEDKTQYSYCCYIKGIYAKSSCSSFNDEAYKIVKALYTCFNKSHIAPPPSPKTCAQIEPKKPSDCSFYATYTHAIYIKDIPKNELPKNISSYFISNYKNTGIIPSILIAHFLIQSEYAQSELFLEANNGFNMKCSLDDNSWKYSSWNSDYKYTKNDIEYRVYDYFEESIADYSAYLLGAKKGNNSIFPGIKNCKDYKKAAKIIKDGELPNYANYEKQLTDIVEEYDLTQYDTYEEDIDEESIRHCCFINSLIPSCVESTNMDYPMEYELYYNKRKTDSFVCKTKPNVNNNCNTIIPNSPSDCQLSEQDRENYQHCCYYNYKNIQVSCLALNEADYKDASVYFEDEIADGSFVCDIKSSGEFLNTINLLLIMLVLIIKY